MVKIILSMIVKNESKIIERCIRSVLPIIDGISICDTGSTDNTVEILNNIIQNGIDGQKLPGKIHNHVWKNFGTNRSQSFLACVDTAKEVGFDLEDTYALLLDADMKLVIRNDFKKSDLIKDGYLIIQQSPVLSYHNIRFIKLARNWTCVGVTHEYWACSNMDNVTDKLDTVFIDDVNDGGCKSDKFERDIRLLTQGLEDEPTNPRYMFYLANSYHDVGQYENSIKYYLKRIEAGGWPEEVFYSIYRIGFCYRGMGQIENALMWFLKSFNYRPQRIEGLFEIANFHRQNQEYNSAYMFLKRAEAAGWPKDDMLFIRKDIYELLIDFELSICCFYVHPFGNTDKKSLMKEGFAACLKILSKRDIPEPIRALTQGNIKFYKDALGLNGPS